VAVGGEAEKGVDRGEAGVAGADAAAAIVLQVFEERAHQRRVEIPELKLRGCLAGPLLRVSEQQPEGVPVRVDGVGAHVALGAEAGDKAGLEARGEHAHGRRPLRAAARSFASDRSSGTADKYQ
jgi:hypothetical protein